MELTAIQKAYKRWAPHYDLSFGLISDWGRSFVVSEVNRKPGRVLEVGVGTGLALPMYAPDMLVTGIDISDNMLDIARKRALSERLRNIEMIANMDATQMSFDDNSYDTATAMYIMSVAPNPEAILNEMVRVVKTGGDVYILNHFSSQNKFIRSVEGLTAPICRLLGWHSVFDMKRIMDAADETGQLELVEVKAMRPLGMFTRLHFKKK